MPSVQASRVRLDLPIPRYERPWGTSDPGTDFAALPECPYRARCTWWRTSRPGPRRATPAPGATRRRRLHDIWDPERYEHLARLLEHARFDAGFFADGLGLPDLYKRQLRRLCRARRPAQPDRPDDGAAVDGARDAPSRPRQHHLHDLQPALPDRPQPGLARPAEPRPRGLERRHLGDRLRGAQLRHGRRAAQGRPL